MNKASLSYINSFKTMAYVVSFACAILLTSCHPNRTAVPQVDKKMLRKLTQEERTAYAKAELERNQKHDAMMQEKRERLIEVAGRIGEAAIRMCDRLPEIKSLCVYEAHVYHSSSVRAWADGNDIHITTAMMNLADEDPQLAYIMAHELAHNLMEHQENLKVLTMIGATLGALLDKAASEYAGVRNYGDMEEKGVKAAQQLYSADQEREADYIGMYIVAEAGYDMNNIPDVWHKMTERGHGTIYIERTHPTNPERLAALRMIINEIKGKQASGETLAPTMLR